MADNTDTEWRSDANDAVSIAFVQPGKGDTPDTLPIFHPNFTYPIFGEEESIFGYKDLKIDLRYTAHDLWPHVYINYAEKFKEVGDTKATDLEELLRQFLPEGAFEQAELFDRRLQKGEGTWFKPPGEKVHSYTKEGRSYEIWRGELTDLAVKQLLERIQILVSFFIEGGVALSLEDQEWTLARWRVFFVYEKLDEPPTPFASQYSFVGYSTCYRFLTYLPTDSTSHTVAEIPPKKPVSVASLPCRGRISQFLILPPHQKQSHGSHLYNTMFETFYKDPACLEITVEDPNEAFDDLRDYSDFGRLLNNGTFAQLQINTDIDPKLTSRRTGVLVPTSKLLNKPKFDDLKAKNKIAPRQWNRLVEMYLLSQIPKHTRESGTARLTQKGKASNPDDRTFYYWRLLVKQRVYKQHQDILRQLDPVERVEKLEDTLNSVLDEYLRLLRRLEENGSVKATDTGTGTSKGHSQRKRRVIEDDDDDDDDDEDKATSSHTSKKPRTDDEA